MIVLAVFVLFSGFSYASGEAPLVLLNDGNKMPVLALGTWLGNSSTGRIEPMGTEVESAVIWALDAGYRHIDTAWSYRVEDQVGRAFNAAWDEWERQQKTTTPRVCDVVCYMNRLRGQNIDRQGDQVPPVSPAEFFITTKLWNTAHAQSAVVPALNASLHQLQLDSVDLYLIHWPIGQFANGSYDGTHFLDTWRGMMGARAQGLTRSIGVSNFNKRMLEEIREHGLAKPAVLQIEWNLNLQQTELLAYCQQNDIVVMGYSPFGSLFHHKAAKGAPPPRVNNRALRGIADKYNRTVPQIVLRYAMELGVVPIPKSFTKSRISENIDVFDFELDDEDKHVLRGFDCGYRTVPQLKWRDHPQYPFEVQANVTNRAIENNNPVSNNNKPIRNNKHLGGNNDHPVTNNNSSIGYDNLVINNNNVIVNNNPVKNNNSSIGNENSVSDNNSTIENIENIENNNSVRTNINPITNNNSTPHSRRLKRTTRKLVTPKIRIMI